METYYITTDLDLESKNDLQTLADNATGEMLVHFCGMADGLYRATFGSAANEANEDDAITLFCNFAEALGAEDRKVWDSCSKIAFNLGYEAGDAPSTWRSNLSSGSIARIANLGGEIIVTIYQHGESVDA